MGSETSKLEKENELRQKQTNENLGNLDQNYSMVAAIDFGTTFCGYAYSFKKTMLDIKMNKNWGSKMGHQSSKVPTSVLVNEKGRFLEFGWQAESKYNEHVMRKGTASCELYRHFKMTLHGQKRLGRATKLFSVRKTPAYAMDIFVHAVRYLKNHLLDAVTQNPAQEPNIDLIRWVLTVPAIWDEEAKGFMREVAFKAGMIKHIDSSKLLICLEPEAASIYCRQIKLDEFALGNDEQHRMLQKPGTKIMIVDAGGGTVDITAPEIQEDQQVKELMAASGGAWGGAQVDNNFRELLAEIFGKEFINRYINSFPTDWLAIMTDFEQKKKVADIHDEDSIISIRLTFGINEICKEVIGKEVKEVLENTNVPGVRFNNGTLEFDRSATDMLFKITTKEIISHLQKELAKDSMKDIQLILLVGGFSESTFLQQAIREEFNSRFAILCPLEAGISIVKGAVLFGHSPDAVRSRLARKTYGIKKCVRFDRNIHDSKRRVQTDVGLCCEVFDPFVMKGEAVEQHSVRHFTCYPAFADATYVTPDILCADSSDVMYPDDPIVQKLGELHVEMPDTGDGLNRIIEFEVGFGFTELYVVARFQGKTVKTQLDFLLD